MKPWKPVVTQVNSSYHRSNLLLININLVIGEDAVESVKERAKESKKKATKKAREAAEETSEAAAKKKRRATDL